MVENMAVKRPSLEALVEEMDLGIEILHPGGLEITRELVELCHINRDSFVLDVACGTGETACFLVETYGCRVIGVDISSYMVSKAEGKARQRGLDIKFVRGDAHNLPFPDNYFDIVISECTVCLLDKEKAMREMARVAKPGGYIGIHDVCWKENTPEEVREKLLLLEGEDPETLNGWRRLFEKAGLIDVIALDKSHLMRSWTDEIKRRIGLLGQLKIFAVVAVKWGYRGLRNIIESSKIFESEYIGYSIIVGRKPYGNLG